MLEFAYPFEEFGHEDAGDDEERDGQEEAHVEVRDEFVGGWRVVFGFHFVILFCSLPNLLPNYKFRYFYFEKVRKASVRNER